MRFSLLELLHQGISTLIVMRIRTFLAALGMLGGTGSLVAIIMCSQMAAHDILKQFMRADADMFVSIYKDSGTSTNQQLTQRLSFADILSIENIDPSRIQVAPYAVLSQQIMIDGKPEIINVLGVTQDFFSRLRLTPIQGRMLSALDGAEPNCVLGYNLAKKIRKNTSSRLLGLPLRVGNRILTVAGIAEYYPQIGFLSFNTNESIFVPLPYALLIDPRLMFFQFFVKLNPGLSVSRAESMIKLWFARYSQNYKMTILTARDITKQQNRQRSSMMVYLAIVGTITLLVGGISIMNIMLISVIERKREIGIRMALGATPRIIGIMFLTEAVLLTLLGSIPGILVGCISSIIIAFIYNWDLALYFTPIIAGVLISIITGILSGMLPAVRAANILPVEALRSD